MGRRGTENEDNGTDDEEDEVKDEEEGDRRSWWWVASGLFSLGTFDRQENHLCPALAKPHCLLPKHERVTYYPISQAALLVVVVVVGAAASIASILCASRNTDFQKASLGLLGLPTDHISRSELIMEIVRRMRNKHLGVVEEAAAAGAEGGGGGAAAMEVAAGEEEVG